MRSLLFHAIRSRAFPANKSNLLPGPASNAKIPRVSAPKSSRLSRASRRECPAYKLLLSLRAVSSPLTIHTGDALQLGSLAARCFPGRTCCMHRRVPATSIDDVG